MPSVSRSQQHFMGAAYGRAKAGHPRASDPKMPISSLRDFAATSTKGLPGRAPKAPQPARGYGKGPLA